MTMLDLKEYITEREKMFRDYEHRQSWAKDAHKHCKGRLLFLQIVQ